MKKNWHVGQKVICVNNTYHEDMVKKGATYIIQNIVTHKCGCLSFDIGIIQNKSGLSWCRYHSSLVDNGNCLLLGSDRFAPFEEKTEISKHSIETLLSEIESTLPIHSN